MSLGSEVGGGARSDARPSFMSRLYDRFYDGVGMMVALLFSGIALGVSIDIMTRLTDWGGISWMLEGSEYALFVATFLGAPWVLKLNGHVRIDLVLTLLPRRQATLLEAFADLCGLFSSAVLFYYAWVMILRKKAEGALIIKDMIFPEWWLYAVVAVAFTLLFIEFLLRLGRLWRARGLPAQRQLQDGGV